MDEIFARDKIHPNAEGAHIIAELTFAKLFIKQFPCALIPDIDSLVSLPRQVEDVPHEVWLCVGQSNMQKGWNEFNATQEEKERVKREMARLEKLNVWLWTGKVIGMLYVAAGGAPTESFLSEQTMCAMGKDGKPLYPHLAAIATNRHRLDQNKDFPCAWVAREYPRRRTNREEACWWPVSLMYDYGIKRIKGGEVQIDGILWYQGESNATTCVAPDKPTDRDYQLETLRALVSELRGDKKIPFIMMGLPKMNRPWEQYRAVQKQVCDETGAIFVDTFAAGLGEMNDVHPRDKTAFADLAAKAVPK